MLKKHKVKRRPMNPAEFNRSIEILGLKQGTVARGLDVDRTTVYRWQHGQRDIPGPVKMLIRTWRKWPETKPE